MKKCGQRLSRASLQHTVAELRGFLRFLGARGETRPGLENQIDTPRVYRGEQLPRALPWETVRAFLQSIDRSSRRGLRDYTMFLLMATYGLRSVEVGLNPTFVSPGATRLTEIHLRFCAEVR